MALLTVKFYTVPTGFVCVLQSFTPTEDPIVASRILNTTSIHRASQKPQLTIRVETAEQLLEQLIAITLACDIWHVAEDNDNNRRIDVALKIAHMCNHTGHDALYLSEGPAISTDTVTIFLQSPLYASTRRRCTRIYGVSSNYAHIMHLLYETPSLLPNLKDINIGAYKFTRPIHIRVQTLSISCVPEAYNESLRATIESSHITELRLYHAVPIVLQSSTIRTFHNMDDIGCHHMFPNMRLLGCRGRSNMIINGPRITKVNLVYNQHKADTYECILKQVPTLEDPSISSYCMRLHEYELDLLQQHAPWLIPREPDQLWRPQIHAQFGDIGYLFAAMLAGLERLCANPRSEECRIAQSDPAALEYIMRAFPHSAAVYYRD